MSYTFQDVSLKAKQKKDSLDNLQVAADVIAIYCGKVYTAFEKETGLKAENHYKDLVYTSYFDKYFTYVTKGSAFIEYVVRKKSFFKDAIVLKGEVYFNQDPKSIRVHIENSSIDPTPYLKQFVNQISYESALLKGN